MLHIDFETRSPVDLKALGHDAYMADPQTSVLCMGYIFAGERRASIWTPGQPFPQRVIDYIESGGDIGAHNAAFERAVFEYGLLPESVPVPRLSQWLCTATLCRARGLPGDLATASYALSDTHPKDALGAALIKACCVLPDCTDARLPELYEYCRADVRAEYYLCRELPPPTEEERALYVAAEAVNDRGVPVDRRFCEAAAQYRDEELAAIAKGLSACTNGAVKSVHHKSAAQKWLLARYPDAPELRAPGRKSGYSLDKSHLGEFAERDDLDDDTRAVVDFLQNGANTSVSKYDALAARSAADGRVRGAFMTNAAHTGRFSSKGAQLHNFKRDVPKEWQALMESVYTRSLKQGVMYALASLLRPTICAEDGTLLVGGDWSGIEARLTAWYGDARKTLAIFANPKRDIYTETASSMGFSDRQVGKVATLACGFGGRGNAFVSMGRNYGMSLSKEEGDEYADAWRRANPWAETLWDDIGAAAIDAVNLRGAGETRAAGGKLKFRYLSSGKRASWLVCTLPSGRSLYYLDPVVVDGRFDQPVLQYRKPQYVSLHEERPLLARTWGGTLTENVVQASAADLLRAALIRLDAEGKLPIIAHVHDELLGMVPHKQAKQAERYLHSVMVTVPAWAKGLPLAAETWHGERYT